MADIDAFLDVYARRGFPHSILDDVWMAGGSFPCFFHGTAVIDYDFFFKNNQTADEFVSGCKRLGVFEISSSTDYQSTNKTTEMICTDKAFTFIQTRPQFQFIVNRDFIGNPEMVLRHHFDFLHVTWYFDIVRNKFLISRNILNAIKHKKLIGVAITHSTEKRIEKWRKRGYRPVPGFDRYLDKIKIDAA